LGNEKWDQIADLPKIKLATPPFGDRKSGGRGDFNVGGFYPIVYKKNFPHRNLDPAEMRAKRPLYFLQCQGVGVRNGGSKVALGRNAPTFRDHIGHQIKFVLHLCAPAPGKYFHVGHLPSVQKIPPSLAILFPRMELGLFQGELQTNKNLS